MNNSNNDYLSIRLNSVIEILPKDVCKKRFIDVGSDHGHLTYYALKYGGFSNAVATDIHKEPANKTKEYLRINDLESVSEVYCTDGLDGIELQYNDVTVMAGLGGNNIVDILSRVLAITDKDILKSVYWCLQPQKSHEELRKFAYANGFNIIDETVCLDRGIFYSIMLLKYDGIVRELSLYEKFYGPVLIKKFMSESTNKLLIDYFDLLDNRYILRSRGDLEVKELMIQLKKIGDDYV